jgi:phosphoglycolate phosphatase
MRYKLAIFDFDGTLADSVPWFLHAVNQAADRYRFRRIEEAEAEMLRGQEARRIIQHLDLPVWKLPLVARFMRQQMARQIASISLFAGVDSVLEQLSHAGVKLAIVSTNSEANIRRVLGPRQAALIQHYEGGASVFGKGPRLRKVLRASGVQPNEALCIGDELRDLQAARAEQIPFGAVAWGYTKLKLLLAHSPQEVFTRVDEISQKLVSHTHIPAT